MQNITPVTAQKSQRIQEEQWYLLPGGVIGFLSYLLALVIPYLIYGASTLFFLLYTWPFFLALLPVSVVAGITVRVLLGRHLVWATVVTLLVVISLFWLLFLFLASW